MEQTELMEINRYIALDYDKEDEGVYSIMKMYFEGSSSIEELYNFLENKGLLNPFGTRAPGTDDIIITEEDLKDFIGNKVLNMSKDEKESPG